MVFLLQNELMPEEKDKSKIKVEVIKEEASPERDTKSAEEESKGGLYFEEKEIEKIAKKEEDQTEENKKPQSKREKTPFFILFLVFIFGLVIGAGLIGGVFYYKVKMEGITRTTIIKETPKPEEKEQEPTPSPQPKEVNVKNLKVLILNGSGIKGEAKKVEDLLKKEDFENNETGNADSYNYTDTLVYLKETIGEGIYEKIEKSLSGFSLKKDILEEDSLYDIKIIIGKTRK